jgi:ribosome-interacting GTPase 1
MGVTDRIKEIEEEMAKTQKNKARSTRCTTSTG